MANLNDAFHADVNDLSDNDNDAHPLQTLNYDSLDFDSVSNLSKTQRFTDTINKVNHAIQKKLVLEYDLEYQLIVECNTLSVEIENEILSITNFIRDKYRYKFPELESLVPQPVQYANVVKSIGNKVDLTDVDYQGIVSASVIIAVTVTGSTTNGRPLSEEVLEKTIEACDRVIMLDESKKKVVEFVESRMGCIAPNLAAVVGCEVAAKLMGSAGGLTLLAKMPACNVQVLGAKKKILAGFSTATSQGRVGYIEEAEVFKNTPPGLKNRVCRLLAAKSVLAARVDSVKGDPSGKQGRMYLEEICKKIEKWQEPPPAKQPKPLPVPDSEPKKKRGGVRLRKRKERYGMTDTRKLVNRMQFGVPEESSLGDGFGEGYGMLGQSGNGKLRGSVGQIQNKRSVKDAQKFKKNQYSSGVTTSGMVSSFAFTPVQGIDLIDPQAEANRLASGTQSRYF